MKLYPKARPVRIKLNVGGEDHSSLDTLRANFNVEEVLKLYESGGLQNWLRQINRLDILDQLSQLEMKSEIRNRYLICVSSFFIELKHIDTVDGILVGMYDISTINFNQLLLAFEKLNPVEYSLSVNGVKELWNKAKINKDNETVQHLSKYLYDRLEKAFEVINEYSSLSEPNQMDDDLRSSIHIISSQWQLKNDSKKSLISNFRNEIRNLMDDEMLALYRHRLFELVNSSQVQYKWFLRGISIHNKGLVLESINTLLADFKDIIYNNFTTERLMYRIKVKLRRKDDKEIAINDKWYNPSSLLEYLRSDDMHFKMNAWRAFFRRMYLIKLSYVKREGKFKEIVSFLESFEGKRGFDIFLSGVNETLYIDTMSKMDSLTTILSMSILFLAVLCAEVDTNRSKVILELCDMGYTPALLLMNFSEPKNDIEKEFMKLSDLQRIPFIAEHILDF